MGFVDRVTDGCLGDFSAFGYAVDEAHARVILEAPGGFAVPVPAGWKLKKVIGKGKGQPAASILVRQVGD